MYLPDRAVFSPSTPIIPSVPPLYLLHRSWNLPMVIGSYFIAVLGAYTATQLICQVSSTHRLKNKLGWLGLASFSLGGTAVWGMHWVKMLAMSIGIPVRFHTTTALLAGASAVLTLFVVLSYDLLLRELTRRNWSSTGAARFSLAASSELGRTNPSDDNLPLLPLARPGPDELDGGNEEEETPEPDPPGSFNMGVNMTVRRRTLAAMAKSPQTPTSDLPERLSAELNPAELARTDPRAALAVRYSHLSPQKERQGGDYISSAAAAAEPHSSNSSVSGSAPPGSASGSGSSNQEFLTQFDAEAALASSQRLAHISTLFLGHTWVGRIVWDAWLGLSQPVLIKGTVLGLVVLCMHYSAMWSMRMDAVFRWYWPYVVISGAFAVGTNILVVMYMPSEPNARRQAFVAFLGPTGISGMHFFGIWSGQIYTALPPPHATSHTMPSSDLPLFILVMAVTTYVLSYAMLAHLITQSRNRLAETIFTKRRLWKAIAEKEAFARANAVKSEFISVASHEIRTPLHAISGYTDLLLQTNLTEEQATFLEAIRMGCHSIQLITNNVLDFSKLEQDSKESIARPTEVDIRTLALRVLQSCATPHRMGERQLRRLASYGADSERDWSSAQVRLPAEKHVELLLVVDENVPAVVKLDEVYITRVVMNLISNALKFTEDGYVRVRITVEPPKSPSSSSSSTPLLAISVRDSGIGIPPESRTTIFEPFRQADTSLTRSHTGAGLGLAISKQLCERMGGTIDLWSKQGAGSEFTVRIPTSDVPAGVPPARSSPELPLTVAIAVRSPKTYLLYKDLLEKRGFAVQQIELSHSARAQQPALALARPDRLWIDMECLAWAPWLLEYVVQLPHTQSLVGSPSTTPISAFVLFDDVGSDAGPQVIQMLKESGRVSLVRRPIVVHTLLQSLRQGIAIHGSVSASPSLTPVISSLASPLAQPLNGKVNGASTSEWDDEDDSDSLPPVLDDGSPAGTGPPRRTTSGISPGGTYWDDKITRVLNPLEPVMHRPPLPPSERRVHFESTKAERVAYRGRGEGAQPASPLLTSPASSVASEKAPITAERYILLVEDNIVNQKLGIRLLQKLSYRCDLAENGQIALDLVTANVNKYGLVLMDCQMPVMNGFECTRRIRALESHGMRSRLPIIALTANVSSESREECQKAGADHFLPKPMLLQDLKDTINQYFPVEQAAS